MSVPKGEMVEWPVAVELDEVFAHRERFISTARWAQMVIEALDRLREDGAASGRLFVLISIHGSSVSPSVAST